MADSFDSWEDYYLQKRAGDDEEDYFEVAGYTKEVVDDPVSAGHALDFVRDFGVVFLPGADMSVEILHQVFHDRERNRFVGLHGLGKHAPWVECSASLASSGMRLPRAQRGQGLSRMAMPSYADYSEVALAAFDEAQGTAGGETVRGYAHRVPRFVVVHAGILPLLRDGQGADALELAQDLLVGAEGEDHDGDDRERVMEQKFGGLLNFLWLVRKGVATEVPIAMADISRDNANLLQRVADIRRKLNPAHRGGHPQRESSRAPRALDEGGDRRSHPRSSTRRPGSRSRERPHPGDVGDRRRSNSHRRDPSRSRSRSRRSGRERSRRRSRDRREESSEERHYESRSYSSRRGDHHHSDRRGRRRNRSGSRSRSRSRTSRRRRSSDDAHVRISVARRHRSYSRSRSRDRRDGRRDRSDRYDRRRSRSQSQRRDRVGGSGSTANEEVLRGLLQLNERLSQSQIQQREREEKKRSVLGKFDWETKELFSLLSAEDFDDREPRMGREARMFFSDKDVSSLLGTVRGWQRGWPGSVRENALIGFTSSGYLAPDHPGGFTVFMMSPKKERPRGDQKSRERAVRRQINDDDNVDDEDIKYYAKSDFFVTETLDQAATQLDMACRFLDKVTRRRSIASAGYEYALRFLRKNKARCEDCFDEDKLFPIRFLHTADLVFQLFCKKLLDYQDYTNPVRAAKRELRYFMQDTIDRKFKDIELGQLPLLPLPSRLPLGSDDPSGRGGPKKSKGSDGGSGDKDIDKTLYQNPDAIPDNWKLPAGSKFADLFGRGSPEGMANNAMFPSGRHHVTGRQALICPRYLLVGSCRIRCPCAHIPTKSLSADQTKAINGACGKIFS